jgi:alkanesulfonate monooxygenase SsuD/methylene tetrahydromethanopterin reductase-like flavin-dependent oxidoreductase (luciferase family)
VYALETFGLVMISFGFAIPTFAGKAPFYSDAPRYARVNWDYVLRSAIEAERLGFNSLWVSDHPIAGGEGGSFEVSTALGALAMKTSTIRIDPLVLCNSYRNRPYSEDGIDS